MDMRQGRPLSSLLLDIISAILSHVISQQIKAYKLERDKAVFIYRNMVIYIENPKESTKKLLELQGHR